MRRHDKRNNPRQAHVRHILVPDKPLARKLIEEISNAKKPLKVFKKSAKIYSTCPSGSKKGDLGEFTEGQMVKEFEQDSNNIINLSLLNTSRLDTFLVAPSSKMLESFTNE